MSVCCKAFGALVKKYPLMPEDSINLREAVQKKAVLKDILFGGLKETDIPNAVQTAFSDLPYANDRQREQKEMDAVNQLMRYARSEKRKAYRPATKGINVSRYPHAMFYSKTPDGTLIIEGVIYHFSKPVISQRKADGGDRDAIELYQILQYLRAFNAMRQKGRTVPERVFLKASVYYMRFATDRINPPHFDTEFFNADKAANIVSILEERYGLVPVLYRLETARTGLKAVSLANYDVLYRDAIRLKLTGIEKDECTDKECDACPIKAACKFVNPPRAIKKTQVQRSVRSMILTKDQQHAVDVEKGIWRINAGAGTGKTLTITMRLIALMNKGVKPEEILMITFTNAAAEEMRERAVLFNKEIGEVEDISGLRITTYNAFGDAILKANYAKLGFTAEPKVIDEVERYRVIADMMKDHPVDSLDYRNFAMNTGTYKGALPIVAKVFEVQKAEGLYLATDASAIQRKLTEQNFFVAVKTIEEIIPLYNAYDEKLRELNLIEFSDQEQMVFELLYNDPYLLEAYGFKHVIVDECQDNSQRQIELLKVLKDTPSFESLMIVGDDSQAIYGFRKTSPEYLIHFSRYINDDVEDIYLLENHRSQEKIIDFANRINDMNINKVSKSLTATRPAGKPVVVRGFCSKEDEYHYVIDGIRKHLAEGCKPEDIAIICYSKPELLKMADLLDEQNIPCVMMNPELLVENSRVQAAIAMIKVMQNIGDTTNLLVYANALYGGGLCEQPMHVIQAKTAEALEAIRECIKIANPAERRTRIIELAEELDDVEDEVYEGFIDALKFKATSQAIYDYANDFNSFGQETAIRRNHSYPGIVLVTAHSSKGLEWPIVYNMISKYDSESLNTSEKIEERRRLLFVSATRARNELYITGQWRAYVKVDEANPKNRQEKMNRYLIDAFKAAGNAVTDERIDAAFAEYKEKKKRR
ncbi:MAG: ATP-dependent helicase [Solobacterium sp.]|nr:ATP-dependent helicase [Solobacterium sp.]